MKVERRTQLSVYLENRVGALADLCQMIADRQVNLLGICAIDTVEEAVLRMLPADEAGARAALAEHGFHVVETEVLLVELSNAPGATGAMAARLARGGVNIDYIYATAHPGQQRSLLALRTHQIADAERILADA
jgi:hypothetical protein